MLTKPPPWFRLYSEVLSDRKIQRICNSTQQPKALVIGTWATILAMASDSPERGKLLISEGLAITFDEIVFETGLDSKTCTSLMDAFIATNMLCKADGIYVVTQWEARQFASDTSNERVRQFREKKRQQQGNNPKQLNGDVKRNGNVTVTPPESDTESENNQEEEETRARVKRHPDFGKVCTAYQYEIGGLSQTVSDALNDDIKTYGTEWVLEAMKRAAKANARNLNYVEAILRNWLAIGGPQNDKPRSGRKNGRAEKNGAYPPRNKSSPALSAEKREAARQLREQDAKEIHNPIQIDRS